MAVRSGGALADRPADPVCEELDYVIADNQLALNAGWDCELLALELGELKLGGFDLAPTGFGEFELGDLLDAAPEHPKLGGFDLALTGFGELELGDLLADRTQGLTDPDDAPAAPEHPVCRTSDKRPGST